MEVCAAVAVRRYAAAHACWVSPGGAPCRLPVAVLAGRLTLPRPCMKMIARWHLQLSAWVALVVMIIYALLMIPLQAQWRMADRELAARRHGEVQAMLQWARGQKLLPNAG